jgi:thiol:disulfide interchange protein DsbC
VLPEHLLNRKPLAKLTFAFAAITAGCLLSAAAIAQTTPSLETIRKAVAPRLSQGAQVEAIAPTPVPGLFEIKINNEIFYVNEAGTYLIQGNLINLANGNNVTRERTEAMMAEIEKKVMPTLWSADARKDSLTMVRGKGERKVIVFEDPYCGYCKQLRKAFGEMDNVTVHTFMVAGLSPDSATKARDIWCAPDKNASYDGWMLGGKAPASTAASKDCKPPTDRVSSLAKQLGVGPVPHIVFQDGTKQVGYLAAADLETRLKKTQASYR